MPSADPALEQLRVLAEFRFALRQFLQFSEQAAQAAGLLPQQHQMMLQIAACPAATVPTIGYIADRLGLRHHSTVELSKRCEEQGLVQRWHTAADRRCVALKITPHGRASLQALSQAHARELFELAPRLTDALARIRTLGSAARTPDPKEETR